MQASRLSAAWVLLLAAGGGTAAQEPPAGVVPQTALSRCVALTLVTREDVAPGTAIAVSADGRRMAQYYQTPAGAEVLLHDRESAQAHRVTLQPPQLPPGLAWRITDAAFSPDGERFFLQSVGAVWAIAANTGEVLYRIGEDDLQRYPGQLSVAADRLLLAFWPPESLVATAIPKGSVKVVLYDAATGKEQNTLFLRLGTPDAWTRLVLSPNGARIAALMRATRWPGKARLTLYDAADGIPAWQRKVSAEDVAWSNDGGELLVLGGELAWLDANTGKMLRHAEKNIRFSEYQRLRTSEPANAALGFFLRFNPLKRTLAMEDSREPQFLLWRLDNGKALCQLKLDEAARVDAWPTSRSELIALEETYDLRPPLRILRAARIVTYRLQE